MRMSWFSQTKLKVRKYRQVSLASSRKPVVDKVRDTVQYSTVLTYDSTAVSQGGFLQS